MGLHGAWETAELELSRGLALHVIDDFEIDAPRHQDLTRLRRLAETSCQMAHDPDRRIVRARLEADRTERSVALGDPEPEAEIGAELSVDYILEGGMRTEGDRVRATVTLVRVRDQAHVWSQAYDREARSLLTLQQDLSAAIADQVRLTLSPMRVQGLARRQTQSAEAYDA